MIPAARFELAARSTSPLALWLTEISQLLGLVFPG